MDYQLTYVYDVDGAPRMLRYRTSNYTDSRKYDDFYLQTNLHGDIVAIYNAEGEQICSYIYDAWGNCRVELESGITTLESSIATTLNPFRYRGYYLDVETGLYYLQTRYYNPNWGRFISADSLLNHNSLLGCNMFAYCGNNPVNNVDYNGEFFISITLICVVAGVAAGATIGGIIGYEYAKNTGVAEEDTWEYVLGGALLGGVIGGIAGYVAAPTISAATGIAGISVTSGGISTVATLGTSFGNLGTLIANDGQQIIDWGKTTWHGMQRMIKRGVTQNMVEVWAKTGKALQQAGDKILYVTKQGVVVIDKAGKVITAYTSQYFDSTMQNVIEKLFGK